MAHTPTPWKVDLDQEFIQDGDEVSIEAVTEDGKWIRREIATVMLDTGENKDGEDWEEDSGNARLIVAACNSYDRHCGANAVQCAEEDLLGQALEALQAALPVIVSHTGVTTLAYKVITKVLAKVKGA